MARKIKIENPSSNLFLTTGLLLSQCPKVRTSSQPPTTRVRTFSFRILLFIISTVMKSFYAQNWLLFCIICLIIYQASWYFASAKADVKNVAGMFRRPSGFGPPLDSDPWSKSASRSNWFSFPMETQKIGHPLCIGRRNPTLQGLFQSGNQIFPYARSKWYTFCFVQRPNQTFNPFLINLTKGVCYKISRIWESSLRENAQCDCK